MSADYVDNGGKEMLILVLHDGLLSTKIVSQCLQVCASGLEEVSQTFKCPDFMLDWNFGGWLDESLLEQDPIR